MRPRTDPEEELEADIADIIESYEPLPRDRDPRPRDRDQEAPRRPTELDLAKNVITSFADHVEPLDDEPLADERPLRAAVTYWNTMLADSQPVLEFADDGILEVHHQVRGEAWAARRGYIARAWLELVDANATDSTAARIGRARTKAEARAIADEIHDRYQGRFRRLMVRDAQLGKPATEIARRFGCSPSTVKSILKRYRP
jgi:hypothetical protein